MIRNNEANLVFSASPDRECLLKWISPVLKGSYISHIGRRT